MVGAVPTAPIAAVPTMPVQAQDSGVVADLDSTVKASEMTAHGGQVPLSRRVTGHLCITGGSVEDALVFKGSPLAPGIVFR